MDLERKTAIAEAPSMNPTAPEGIIDALVAVTGIRDEVDDIITPGAFTRTLQERTPKVCLGHDWNRPIGKTLTITELMPGDPLLPQLTKDGRPWPAEAGAVLARSQYNLATDDGMRAWQDAKFFGLTETTFSIGYRVTPGGARHVKGVRHIDDLDLFEYSQVLHPAMPLASLQGIKAALDSAQNLEAKTKYVRDMEYWGLPVGTPITPGMKPRGHKAQAERDEGREPDPEAGLTSKPKSDAKPGADAQPSENPVTPGVKPKDKASSASPMDITQSKKFIDDNYGDWRKNLTPNQEKSIRFYQSPGYALMNGQLRGLDPEQLKTTEHATDADLQRARKASKDLNSAIAVAPPLKEPLTAFRGFSANQFGNLEVGKKIQDKAFVSLSLTDDAGAVGRATEQATAEIRLPAGTKVAAGSARELILPPGASFTVASTGTKGGKKHFVLDYNPPGGKSKTPAPTPGADSPTLTTQQRGTLHDAHELPGGTMITAAHETSAHPLVKTGHLERTKQTGVYKVTDKGRAARATLGADTEDPATRPDRSTPAMWRKDPAGAADRLTGTRRSEYDQLGSQAKNKYAARRAQGDDHPTALTAASDGDTGNEAGGSPEPASARSSATPAPKTEFSSPKTADALTKNPDADLSNLTSTQLGHLDKHMTNRADTPTTVHPLHQRVKDELTARKAGTKPEPENPEFRDGIGQPDTPENEHAQRSMLGEGGPGQQEFDRVRTEGGSVNDAMDAGVDANFNKPDVTPEPDAAAPDTDVPAPTPFEIDAVQSDTDTGMGISEGPDGEIDVDDDVAQRQDRVESLLESEPDLTAKSDDELISDRSDLVAELQLQGVLAQRDESTKPKPRVAAPAQDAAEPVSAKPKTRPGVAGAAEDLADALDTGDAEAQSSARDRYESALRRSRSDSEHVATARQTIDGNETGNDATTPEGLRDFAKNLRDERRTTANEKARAQRAAKRLDRDRIKALIGQYDQEIRKRNLDSPDNAAPVPGGSGVSAGQAPEITDPATAGGQMKERAAELVADPSTLLTSQSVGNQEANKEAAQSALASVAETYSSVLAQATPQQLAAADQRVTDAFGSVTNQASVIAMLLPAGPKRNEFLNDMRLAMRQYGETLSRLGQ
jgi:phage head maturation protease